MKTDISHLLLAKYGKNNPPALKAGDTVRVHQKIKEGDKERVQVFEGLVIACKHGHGLDGTFTVRKIAAGGIGVERTYPLHSPNIVKVERTKSAEVSRAKLYYMRDRLGKAARFKNEDRTSEVWVEAAPVAEEPVSEEVEIAPEEETVQEVAEAPAAAPTEADAEVAEENAAQAPEAEEAAEEVAAAEESEEKKEEVAA